MHCSLTIRFVKWIPAGLSAAFFVGMIALAEPQSSERLAAVAAAWSAYRPDFKRPVKLVNPIPPRDGWDERKNFDYETSPNERAVIGALARRAGDQWTVVILEGTEPTFEK